MNFFDWIWKIISEYYPLFLKGIGNTMLIAIIGTVAGFGIGLLVAIIRTVPEGKNKVANFFMKIVKFVLVAYIEVFRGTPMMIQAAVIYYGIVRGRMDLTVAALIIVSINTGAYMAEIIRGGIISVDVGQTEGAMSLGMTHWQTMVHVVLPQAIRNIMPSVGNEFVVNIKDTSVLNVIGVSELYFQAKSAAGTYYKFFESFVIAAVIYFILTFVTTRILKLMEKKMEGKKNYTIFGSQSDFKSTIHLTEDKAR